MKARTLVDHQIRFLTSLVSGAMGFVLPLLAADWVKQLKGAQTILFQFIFDLDLPIFTKIDMQGT